MNNKKFIDTIDLTDYEIWTDTGWEEISHIHKTVPYDVWEVVIGKYVLKCADEHIVIGENGKEIFVKDLRIGDLVMTIDGLISVDGIKKYDYAENMYDVTVTSDRHTLFTNNILSHNTTINTIFFTWYALFHKDKTIAVLAHKEKAAMDILKRIKFAYEQLPLWMQQGIRDGGWNKKEIILENGVTLFASSTSSNACKSYSINLLYLDEFAFVPDHIADDFMSSVYPTIASGETSRIIISSTPNGMNSFYHLWKNSVNGTNNYYPIKIRWDEVPGRDEKFKESTISDIGIVKWNAEFAGKFLGSSNTLIDSDMLERIEVIDPIAIKWNGLFHIYELPMESAMYILGVDSSKGTGLDFSVIQVIKIIDENNIKQVAIYRYNKINPHEFAEICVSISEFYNKAYMMIENNDVGSTVADTVWYEYECDRIVNCDKKGLGVRSTKTSKLAANMLLKRYMENGWLELCDQKTVFELSKYKEISPNVFQSGREDHDDCVTSLIWAIYFITTTYFDGKNIDIKHIDNKYKLDKEDFEAPVMIFDE